MLTLARILRIMVASHERKWGAKKSHFFERIGGIIFFIYFVVAYLIFGANAAIKILGVAAVCVGGVWFLRRRVPFGIEGEAPTGEMRGYIARIAGITMLIIGLLMLTYSVQVACSIGWAEDSECFRSS